MIWSIMETARNLENERDRIRKQIVTHLTVSNFILSQTLERGDCSTSNDRWIHLHHCRTKTRGAHRNEDVLLQRKIARWSLNGHSTLVEKRASSSWIDPQTDGAMQVSTNLTTLCHGARIWTIFSSSCEYRNGCEWREEQASQFFGSAFRWFDYQTQTVARSEIICLTSQVVCSSSSSHSPSPPVRLSTLQSSKIR